MSKAKNYSVIRDTEELKRWVDTILAKDTPIAMDIETGYSGPMRLKGAISPYTGAYIVGFSFTDDPSWARYVPLHHAGSDNVATEKEVWEIVKPLFEARTPDGKGRIVCHNAAFEKMHLRKVGIELALLADTMLMAYTVSDHKVIKLKTLVSDIFKHNMMTLEELFEKSLKKDAESLNCVKLSVTPELVAYGCEDSAWCLELYYHYLPKVEEIRCKPEKLRKYTIHDIELATLDVLVDMQEYGVSVNWDGMEAAYSQIEVFEVQVKEEALYELERMSGRDLSKFNMNSTKQMRELLFEDLKLTPTSFTKKGAPSTDAKALNKFAKKVPAIKLMLELREVGKFKTTLAKWLDKQPIDKDVKYRGKDGKMHPSYMQHVVGTGRFSAADPPIQQVPKYWFWALGDARAAYYKAVEEGKSIGAAQAEARKAAKPGEVCEGNMRAFIIASPGNYMVSFDYSQIELRVIAALADEKALLDAYEKGVDVHTKTASMMLGIPISDVGSAERGIGKTMNFGLVYGMGPGSLSQRLGISLDRAHELMDEYMAQFPSITNWIEKVQQEGRKNGYSYSWLGRKNTLWDYKSTDKRLQGKGDRLCINSPVQGGAADIAKLAMIRARVHLQKKGWWMTKVWMIMNQHDSLVFEVSADIDPREFAKFMRPLMEEFDYLPPNFPKIVSEWEVGATWGESVPFDENTDLVRVGDCWVPEGVVPTTLPESQVDEEADREAFADIEEDDEEVEEPIVEVVLSDMPSPDEWKGFLDYLSDGSATVDVVMPEGKRVRLEDKGLGLEDRVRVMRMLPGATVRLQKADALDLSEGMVL